MGIEVKKKLVLIPSLLLLIITLVSIPVFAGDQINQELSKLIQQFSDNTKKDNSVIVMVGDQTITQHEFDNIKAVHATNSRMSNNSAPDDDEILKSLIIDRLLIDLAREKGIYVSDHEITDHIRDLRKTLKEQSEEVNRFQQEVIKLTGLDEEAYWTEYAPAKYKDLLIKEKLYQILLEEGSLPNTKDPAEFESSAMDFRTKIYEDGISQGKVEFK